MKEVTIYKGNQLIETFWVSVKLLILDDNQLDQHDG